MAYQPREKTPIRAFVYEEMGPGVRVSDVAEMIGHSEVGMRKMFRENPRKLRALVIGYKVLRFEDSRKAAAEAREKEASAKKTRAKKTRAKQ